MADGFSGQEGFFHVAGLSLIKTKPTAQAGGTRGHMAPLPPAGKALEVCGTSLMDGFLAFNPSPNCIVEKKNQAGKVSSVAEAAVMA